MVASPRCTPTAGTGHSGLPHPTQASILLHGAHPTVQYVDTVWRMVAGLDAVPVANAAGHVERVVAQPGIAPLLIDGVELFERADVIHLVGGGYLNSLWPHHLSILAAAVAVRRRHGASVVLTGHGLLPAADADHVRLLRHLVEQTTLTDVRDRESDELLGPGDAQSRRSVTGDDGWLGVADPNVYESVPADASRRRYMVCVQTHLMAPADGVSVGVGDSAVADDLEARVGGIMRRWGMTADNTTFVEAMPGDDGVLYKRFVAHMPGLELLPFTAVWRNGFPADVEQTWITTRFHAHLLAAARGASGVVMTGRSDYYPVKHRSLFEQGSRWRTVDEVGDTPPVAGGFPPDVVRALAAGKRALAAEIYPRQ